MPLNKTEKIQTRQVRPRQATAGYAEILRWIAAFVLCCNPVDVFAQAIDTDRPQGEMLTRIERTIDAYASRLSVGASVVSYCHTQMRLDTRSASDGSIPFGVNYRTITSQEQLKSILSVREAYETTYLKLCIARAKRDFVTVERP